MEIEIFARGVPADEAVRLYARQCLARVLRFHECETARLDLELGSSVIEGRFPAVRATVEVDRLPVGLRSRPAGKQAPAHPPSQPPQTASRLGNL